MHSKVWSSWVGQSTEKEKFKKIIAWLEEWNDAGKYAIGKMFDLWQGTFEENDPIAVKG